MKKEYIKPIVLEMEIVQECPILAGSDVENILVNPSPDDPTSKNHENAYDVWD